MHSLNIGSSGFLLFFLFHFSWQFLICAYFGIVDKKNHILSLIPLNLILMTPFIYILKKNNYNQEMMENFLVVLIATIVIIVLIRYWAIGNNKFDLDDRSGINKTILIYFTRFTRGFEYICVILLIIEIGYIFWNRYDINRLRAIAFVFLLIENSIIWQYISVKLRRIVKNYFIGRQ